MLHSSLKFGLALAFAVPGATTAFATSSGLDARTNDFLYAIRMVESGNHYDCPPGPYGEQGPYQFRHSVWRQYTTAPFWEARTSFADEIAHRHYDWLVSQLRHRGISPSVWELAAAWNGGVGAVTSGHIPRAARAYATSVRNLVQEAEQVRVALTPHYRLTYASVP